MTDPKVYPVRGKKKITKKKKVKIEDVDADTKSRIMERVAREEKAYRIVERMIDNPVSLQLLEKSLKYLNQSTYNDIVEERSIVKNCGYPLCTKPLPPVLKKQTYAIRSNKVYKLEDRVKFCCSFCFSCSRALRDQLSMEPVWLMPKSAHKNIQITPPRMEDNSATMTIPFTMTTDNMKTDTMTTDTITTATITTEELPRNIKIDESYLHEDEEKIRTPTVIRERKTVSDRSANNASTTESIQAQFSWLNLDEDDSDEEEEDVRPARLSLVDTIKASLTQWSTSESCAFLSGITTSALGEDDDDLQDDLLDDDLRLSLPENRAPLPHLKELDSKDVIIKETLPHKMIILPKIDSVNQAQQRQHIVLTKLQPAMDRILLGTTLSYSDFSHLVCRLVTTLNLRSANCMFSEKAWTIVAGVIMCSMYDVTDIFKSLFSKVQLESLVYERVSGVLTSREDLLDLCSIFCQSHEK